MNWLNKVLSYLFSKPHIIEKGTDSGWEYIKWSDGTFTARIIFTPTIRYTPWATVEVNGLKMWGGNTSVPALPSGFVGSSGVASLVQVNVPSGVVASQAYLRGVTTTNINVGMMAAGTVTSFTAPTKLVIDVMGTWQ